MMKRVFLEKNREVWVEVLVERDKEPKRWKDKIAFQGLNKKVIVEVDREVLVNIVVPKMKKEHLL